MKPVMKNITIDNHNAELVDFAQTVDFTELFDHVKAFAGVECEFYQPEITTGRGEVHISFMSDDITAQTGAFAAILERCCIHSFSNGVFMDQKTGELAYWVSVNLQYEHKDGGSNDMDMVRAWYINGEWVFTDAGQGGDSR
jgi:hypothetical protein